MRTMKLAMMFVALAAISVEGYAAMSMTDVRREARFLTDRMGHELGLSNRQYNDVYEINFDFLHQVNEVIDDVVYGYDDAIDYYYYLLDVRNEDLMYVLRSGQYRKFMNRDYFYRPIYMVGHTWGMRIWDRYSDRNYFYFSIPACYHTYSGAHNRIHFVHSYYAGLYSHALFHGAFRLWGGGYDHYRYDGWHCIGHKKHTIPNSRPWSNAKNYEKSRRDLKSGFISVPSRDESKRMVKVNSVENNRTAVTSNPPIRTGSDRTEDLRGDKNVKVNRGVSAERSSRESTATRKNGSSNVTAPIRSSSSSSSVSGSRGGSSDKNNVSSGSNRSTPSRSSSTVSRESVSRSSSSVNVSRGSSSSHNSRSNSNGSSRSSSSTSGRLR